MTVTEFQKEYESRVRNVRSAADRRRVIADLSDDFTALVREWPHERNALHDTKEYIESLL